MSAPTALPCPDPASFVAEPLLVEELIITDPAHVARTVNLYAKVLVECELSEMVADLDAASP